MSKVARAMNLATQQNKVTIAGHSWVAAFLFSELWKRRLRQCAARGRALRRREVPMQHFDRVPSSMCVPRSSRARRHGVWSNWYDNGQQVAIKQYKEDKLVTILAE